MRKFIYKILFILFLALLLIDINQARSEERYSTSNIVDAIWIIEGGLKTNYPFGIRSVYCNGYDDCRQVCVNTVENNRVRFSQYGYKQEKDFLTFLAKRYCPDNWEVWLKNLKFYLKKG